MTDRIPTEAVRTPAEGGPSLTSLVSGIVTDLQQLVRQELALAKREVQQEWDKTKTAASSMAAGAGLLVLGAVLLCFMLVYLLHEVAGLNLWLSFLIVGGVITGAGAALLAIGWAKGREVRVIPPQTAETIKENVQWLKNQT